MEAIMILVTGASRGAGKSICENLLQNGQRVIGTYCNTKPNTLYSHENLEWKHLDSENPISVNKLLEEIHTSKTEISFLVNNAGIAQKKDILQISEEDWQKIFRIHFFTPVQLLVELTRQNNLKRAINIVSVSAFSGGKQQPHYAAAKAAMCNYTKSFAHVTSKTGVIVNAIAPGLVDTDMLAALNTDVCHQDITKDIPVARLGTVEDIASIVKYLLINDGGYINGQVITVNGGTHV